MHWTERLRHELAFVLGAAAGEPLARELAAAAAGLPLAARPATFDNPREALLITYGDQVTSPGERPLVTLRRVLAARAHGLVSGVHVLPFYPWSSDDGFAVKDFFAVDPALGTWEDVRALAREFDLMADAVINHASASGDWFARFLADEPGYGEFFTTVTGQPDLSRVIRPRALPLLTEFATARGPRRVWTTFSADQADLNFRDHGVVAAVSRALLHYLACGARYVRLDAIGFIWKEPGTTCLHLPQAHALVRAWSALADGAAPGSRVVTETNVPHLDNISYFGDGTNEASMVYNFALPPLVLHTLRTGDSSVLTRWAGGLSTPSPRAAFFNFLASHDGIGLNPVRGLLSEAEISGLVASTRAAGGAVSMKSLPDGGEAPYELNINYFDALAAGVDVETAIRRFVVAHAICFALAGIPGVYFHSLFGSRGDPEGARTSGIPRRINRQRFERTRLDAALEVPGSRRARIHSAIGGLLRRRAGHPAFAPSSPQRVLDFGPGIFALERGPRWGRLVCLHEVGGRARRCGNIELPAYGVRWIGAD